MGGEGCKKEKRKGVEKGKGGEAKVGRDCAVFKIPLKALVFNSR